MAAGWLRRHRAAVPRPGLVLADPGRHGRRRAGLPRPPPALARLAQIRAVLAARLWLQASPAWHQGHAWWHSGRHIRAVRPAARARHLPAAEIHWPSLPASPYAGQVRAVEVELTPKPLARTARIISALQGPARYAQVIYLTTRSPGWWRPWPRTPFPPTPPRW